MNLKILALWVIVLILPAVSISQIHPDGIIGQFNGSISMSHTVATPEENIFIDDNTAAQVSLVNPVSEHFSIGAKLMAEFGDTTYYTTSFSTKIYLSKFSKSAIDRNPDGTLWSPILDFAVSYRLSEISSDFSSFGLRYGFLVPVSSRFSIGAGGFYFDSDDIFRVKHFYGQVNFFPRDWTGINGYLNPDGTDGSPSFSLVMGGSENGFFGQFDILFPVSYSSTIVVFTRGERTPSPYVRKATIGARIHYYPQN